MSIPGFRGSEVRNPTTAGEPTIGHKSAAAEAASQTTPKVEDGQARRAHRVNLPGFISEDVGLGDIVKRVTSTIGIRPCGGCLRRAQALNSLLVFGPRSKR